MTEPEPNGNQNVSEFDWNSKTQGIILSSFFYGYITTQILGGYLADKFGGKRIFGCGIGITALLTLITPWLVEANMYLLLVVRIIEGIFEGVTYPGIHAVWAKWAPPLERSRLATFAFSGSYLGTVVALPLSAYLAENCGWPSIFYVFGTIGILWFFIWIFVVAEKPEFDKNIYKSELTYITESLSETNKINEQSIPWRSILTSRPVWAIIVSHFSENWGFYTLSTQLPQFMKDVLNYDLELTGILSALPYITMTIMVMVSGQMADWFITKNIFTITQVRKIFNCGAFSAQTIFMIGASFWTTSTTGSIICLTLSIGLGAFSWAGFSVNHLDIAPQYASVLMGLSNTFATIPGIVSPILTGYIVTTPSVAEWQIIFYISSGVYIFGCIFYGIFASGELQSWAKDKQTQ